MFTSKLKLVPPPQYWGNLGSQVILWTEGVDRRRGTDDNRKSSEESDSDSKAVNKQSRAVKLLDYCPAPFPHGVSVWRLTAGLSKRPPPRSPRLQRPITPDNSERQYHSFHHRNWEHLSSDQACEWREAAHKRLDSQVQSQPEREHNSHNLIMWHG